VNRAQRVFVVVVLGVLFLLLHRFGIYYYERQEDPSLNVILLFRVPLVDSVLLALWGIAGFALLRDW